MAFNIFMLICNLLVPLIMIIFGTVFIKKPPQHINSHYGYRTPRSAKNYETWFFAHRVCGSLWRILGLVLLPITIVFTVITWNLSVDALGYASLILMGLQLVFLVGSIFIVENALKKNFDRYGRKK